MGKPFQGSICLSDLNEKAKEGHSAFSRAQNGKIYFNATLWENDQADKFGNTRSIQLNPAKDSPDEKKYIGNFKPSGAEPLQPSAVIEELPADDDLPF